MNSIAIVGSADKSYTLLADLFHWHGLSALNVDAGESMLSLLSLISPELIIVKAPTGGRKRSADSTEAICDRIRQSPVLGYVPIVVCADRRGARCGADAYLHAPYTAEDVFAVVQDLCPSSMTAAEAVTTSGWGE